MTHQEALDRVQKLLRLAKSDNPHEAANAAAMAQKIIDRHKLDVASLEDTATVEPVRDETLDSKTSSWLIRLAGTLAALNNVQHYYRPRRKETAWRVGAEGSIQLIGRASDVQTVRYLYQWLSKEIDRLCDRDGQGEGKTWRNNFRLGAVESVGRRLREEKEVTKKEAMADAFARDGEQGLLQVNSAIVRVADRSEVDAFAKSLKLRNVSSRTTYNDDGREAGRRAGNSIGLSNRGVTAAGARQLGRG